MARYCLLIVFSFALASGAMAQGTSEVLAKDRFAAESAKPALMFNAPPALVETGWESARCMSVEYAPGLVADLYLPAVESDKPLPVVLLCFNFTASYFVTNLGKRFREMPSIVIWLASLANRGLAVLCPDVDWPARDMQEALRWIKAQGPKYRIDPTRLAFLSFSANPKILPYVAGLPESSNLRAIVLYYADVQPASWSLSPRVAVQIVEAGKDNPSLNRRLETLAERLRAAGNPLEHLVYEEGDHAFDLKERGGKGAELMSKTFDFLQERLR